AEAKAKQEAEAARLKAEQEAAKARAEAEAARVKAEQEAAAIRAQLEAAKARAEAEAKARAEAEAKAKQEAEAARLKAEQEAARAQAELEAAKARAEAEARARAEAEAKAKQEAEAAHLKVEQESSRKQAEAEEARLKAEQEAARAQAELEAAKIKAEAEAKAHAEAEARARQEAETARLRAEREAARAKAEFESAKAREVAETKARAEAEAKVRQEAETARVRAEVEAKARQEAEAARLKAEQDARSIKAEAGEQPGKATAAKAEATGRQPPVSSPTIELAPILFGNLGSFEAEAQKESDAEAPQGEIAEEPPLIFQEFVVGQESAKEAPPAEVAGSKRQQETGAERKAAAERKAQQEAEAARIKAEQEAARIRAEAGAEEAAREMAEAQARVWAEAEQRARSLAEAQALVKAESAAAPAAPQAQTKAAPPVSRKRGKPLPLGKMVAGLFVLLLASVAALPYLWPMQDYATKIESNLSAQLRQPVHIGRMKAALLPMPKLELQDVSVGNAHEWKAGSVVLHLGFAALFAETKPIGKAEIDNLTLGAESFGKALGWMQAVAGDAQHPVAHIVLRRVKVGGEGINLPTINGSADLDAQGRITRVALNSEDGKLDIELKPQQPRWQIALNLRESSLPLLPGIQFNELNAKGEAGEESVSFSEMDGRLYGGMLMGNAKLSWQKGWQIQGRVTVKTLELQKAMPHFGISGEMDGDASFSMSGEKLVQLANAPGIDGSFVVKKGAINNMDMVEAASSNRQGAAGGRTHFDELTGMLLADASGQHLRQIKIAAGVMSANGSVDIGPDKQLSGRLNVELKMRAGMGSVPLSLTGVPGKPALRVAR
ncbi:MAG: hypothetical protein HZC43_11045, partial [Nitrosomonadales bacterium]|nr:hypothetical protein [Nitrosomonadales bacterium]